MLHKGDQIRVRKVSASANPQVRTPSKEEHVPGEAAPITSLPVDYEMEGELLADLSIGKGLYMFRTKRNGIERPGITETSMIIDMRLEELSDLVLETENSIYTVHRL